MLPAGMPETSSGMQVRSETDMPGLDNPVGEVRIAGNKKSVVPCVDLQPVYAGKGVIGEGSSLRGERVDVREKNRGCRLVIPEFIQKLLIEAPESRCSTSEVSCSQLGIRQESERSTFRRLEDLATLMGFVKSLGVTGSTSQYGRALLPRDCHPVMETFVDLFEHERLSLNSFYEVRFFASQDVDKLYLRIKHTQPLTLPTPDIVPDKEKPFEYGFTSRLALVHSADGVCIELDSFSNDRIVSELINQVRSLDPFDEESSMKFLIRFCGKIPDDQTVSKIASYRIVAGSTDRNQRYLSYSAPVKCYQKGKLYIEVQVPFIYCPDPAPHEIVDVRKQFKSTKIKPFNMVELLKKSILLSKKTDHPNQQEKGLINQGECIGSGISQDVYPHAEHPDVALKQTRRSMLPYEAGISINTSEVTLNLSSCVMTEPSLKGKRGEISCVASPVAYMAVVKKGSAQGAKPVYESNVSEKSIPDGTASSEKSGVAMRLRNSPSECEAFNDAFDCVDRVPVSLRPEDDESVKHGSHAVALETEVNGGQYSPENHEVHGLVTVLGMQRKYKRREMVEYILKDPNEKPAVKSEIIEGILDLIDRCDRFNKRMEEKGNGWVIKFVIDGNFANFAYDRDKHQLIYLDFAPATVMIDGEILPGNQFMMEWITERHDFISKMSEDSQMSKLFFLVMLTNDLRQLEKTEFRLEQESVYNKLHESKIRSLRNVVNTASVRLSEDDDFLSWCAFHFLVDSEMNLENFRYNPRIPSDVAGVVSDYFNRYIKESWTDYNKSTLPEVATANLEKIKSLPFTGKGEFLRMMSDVVFDHMGRIKKSLATVSEEKVNGDANILSEIEVGEMMGKAINGEIEHCFSSAGTLGETFFDVVFHWLERLKFYGKLKAEEGERVFSSAELKEQLKRDIVESDTGESESGSITVPCFLRMMDRVYGKEINVVVIEPFCGHDKLFRTGCYEWKSVSQDERLCLEEYTGLEAFHRILKRSTMDTMFLVNHQLDNSYLIGDVSHYRWSSIFVKNKGEQINKLDFSLGVTYTQCQDGYAKLFFEKIIHGLKELYEAKKKEKLRGATTEYLSDEKFLEKLIEWIPEDCSAISNGAMGGKHITIKMDLSSSIMFRLRPLLRGYIDMVQHEFGKERSSKIYIIMRLPSKDAEEKCARWMLLLTKDEKGNDISVMDFNCENTLPMLREKIRISKSRPGSSSKPGLIFVDGACGSRLGSFFPFGSLKARVLGEGEGESSPQEIDRPFSYGQPSVSTAERDSHVRNPDAMNTLECERQEIDKAFSDGQPSVSAAERDSYVRDPDAMNSLECEHEVNMQVYEELYRFQEY